VNTPPGKRRLGRGLDGMLPAAAPRAPGQLEAAIEELHPNRSQPRRHFDDDRLEELAQSIREHGVLEPILVRKRPPGGFEIIAGERRWRAAQKAGLREVPVHVRELSDRGAFEASLVENLQREDLNPIETARAFQRLVTEYGLTQETIAERVGKDRSTIANSMRLLKLPDVVLDQIEAGELTEGHGRALLTAPEDKVEPLARAARLKGLSVRELEKRARDEAQRSKGTPPTTDPGGGKSANVLDLERRLGRSLGSTVSIDDKDGKGQIVIRYASLDELDRLLKKLL
jgi:ParB family chromosome partitioning protein